MAFNWLLSFLPSVEICVLKQGLLSLSTPEFYATFFRTLKEASDALCGGDVLDGAFIAWKVSIVNMDTFDAVLLLYYTEVNSKIAL